MPTHRDLIHISWISLDNLFTDEDSSDDLIESYADNSGRVLLFNVFLPYYGSFSSFDHKAVGGDSMELFSFMLATIRTEFKKYPREEIVKKIPKLISISNRDCKHTRKSFTLKECYEFIDFVYGKDVEMNLLDLFTGSYYTLKSLEKMDRNFNMVEHISKMA